MTSSSMCPKPYDAYTLTVGILVRYNDVEWFDESANRVLMVIHCGCESILFYSPIDEGDYL